LLKRITVTSVLLLTIMGGTDSFAQSITHPYVAIDEINKRDKVRFEQEQQDRMERKRQKAEDEERAKERRKVDAFSEAKRARKAYVKRIRANRSSVGK
jgi:hypothetical protein